MQYIGDGLLYFVSRRIVYDLYPDVPSSVAAVSQTIRWLESGTTGLQLTTTRPLY